MDKNIISYLADIQQYLPKNCFGENINDTKSNKFFNENISFKEEIYHIYSLKTIVKIAYVDNACELCSFGNVLSIPDAIKIYRGKKSLGFEENHFFPILSNFSGDYLVVKSDKSDEYVYIYSPSLFIVNPIKIFENIYTFIKCIYMCYSLKAYNIIDHRLEIDMELEENILKKK